MNNITMKLCILGSVMLSVSGLAQAAGAPLNVTVNGSVTAQTCEVHLDGAGGSVGTVALPTSDVNDVGVDGDTNSVREMTITLANCSSATAETSPNGKAALLLSPGPGGTILASGRLFGGSNLNGMVTPNGKNDLGILVTNTTPAVVGVGTFKGTGDIVQPNEYALIHTGPGADGATTNNYTAKLKFMLAEVAAASAKPGEGISAPITLSYFYI